MLQADDIERFMFFSRAALEFMLMVNKQPDVVHLHDWQSAAVVSGMFLFIVVHSILHSRRSRS